MADAENVSFVVQAADIFYFDCPKGTPDGRISAFFKKGFFAAVVFHGAEYGREGQETLIGIVMVELLFHTGVSFHVDEFVVGVKKQAVFRKASAIHVVGERGCVAPVKIEAFRKKESGGRFEKIRVDGQSVFAKLKGEGNTDKMSFEQRSFKQFVA